MRTGLLEDVYLTLVSSPNESGRITVGVQTQPLTLWLWIGGGLMALGTIIALAPRVRRRVDGRADRGDATRTDRAADRAPRVTRPDPDVIGARARSDR